VDNRRRCCWSVPQFSWILVADPHRPTPFPGVVVLFAVGLTLYCAFRKKKAKKAGSKKNTKGEHHKIPSGDPEATLPPYHNEGTPYDPYQKQDTGTPHEKPLYPVPYDPVYPSQHYDHQETASIASSIYNGPAVTYAQPQDYSYQHYYHTGPTAQPGMYAPPPAPPHN
jgi:hypothetical protein